MHVYLYTYTCVYAHMCIHICVYVQAYVYSSEDLFSRALISSKEFNESIVFTPTFISFAQMNHY